jgi:hypothetical protein
MSRLRDKLNLLISICKSYFVDVVNHKFSFAPYYNYLTEFKFKSNLKYIKDIIMPPKRKTIQRPIDCIREIIEDQQLQINDLTEVVANQKLEIRELKSKWNAKENIEREKREAEEQKKLESSSWFFAARSSE